MGIEIFLVEDDSDLRESFCDLLESEGYVVDSAVDGLDALKKLQARTRLPDLILLDWMMPKMDGAQFCAERQKLKGIADIPVILLTADGRLQEKVKAVGAAVGVAKPVDVDLLLQAIAQLVTSDDRR